MKHCLNTGSLLRSSQITVSSSLRASRTCGEYLALGNIAAAEDHIIEALSVFNIDLDRNSAAYPKLGIEVLRAYVRALQDIEKRNAGDPVPTPTTLTALNVASSGTLLEAFEGWKKERERPEGTLHEYGRAVTLFIQLHGNLPILEIKRSHARTFREALQLVPRFRKGSLLKASLPELSELSGSRIATRSTTASATAFRMPFARRHQTKSCVMSSRFYSEWRASAPGRAPSGGVGFWSGAAREARLR